MENPTYVKGAPACIVCGAFLQPPYVAGMPDFPGDGPDSRGQTMTQLPGVGIGKGTFMACLRCRITYRINGLEQ